MAMSHKEVVPVSQPIQQPHITQLTGAVINPEAFTFNDISKNIQGVPEDGPIVHGEKKHDFKLQHRKLYDDYLKIVDHLLEKHMKPIQLKIPPREHRFDEAGYRI